MSYDTSDPGLVAKQSEKNDWARCPFTPRVYSDRQNFRVGNIHFSWPDWSLVLSTGDEMEKTTGHDGRSGGFEKSPRKVDRCLENPAS